MLIKSIVTQETAAPAPSAGPDALLKEKTKQKRMREGYEEGISLAHRPASAASFIAAEKPVEVLGRFTRCACLRSQPRACNKRTVFVPLRDCLHC